jgi:2-polyprenyl-6-methoxyphenol hydroxylase-like FAD-dependent oxidoreductase
MTIKVDILVSGAGPVGLYFAYLMASKGHSVYICDVKPGPTDQSRAILVSSRTLEALDAKGLAAELLSESYIPSGVRVYSQGKLVSSN